MTPTDDDTEYGLGVRSTAMETGAVTYIKLEVDLVVAGHPVRYVITGEPEPGAVHLTVDPNYAEHGPLRILDTIALELQTVLQDCTLHTYDHCADDSPALPRLRAL